MYSSYFMNTLLLLLTLCGFYLLINTSKKAVLRKGKVEKWIQRNPTKAKVFGLLCVLFTLVIAVFLKGITGGIAFSVLYISLSASLIIILNPLKTINYKLVFTLFLITLIIELFLKNAS